MRRNVGFPDLTGVVTRTVQKGATCPTGTVDDLLGQGLKVVAIVVVFFADHIDQTCPAPAQADNLTTLADRAQGNGTDCRIQTGYVAPSGEDSDHSLFLVHIRHFSCP